MAEGPSTTGGRPAHDEDREGDFAAFHDAAYTRAWPRWSRWCEYDDPGAWVRQVVSHQAVSGWRRRRTALRMLPETQRRAIVLHHLAGLSVAEVAAAVALVVGVASLTGLPGGSESGLAADPAGRIALAAAADTDSSSGQD